MADRSFEGRNVAGRERLERFLARLDPAAHATELDGGWTVGALLGHLAFWDRMVLARWELARRTGAATPIDLPDAITDLLNEAAMEGWRALSPEAVAELVDAAATAVDGVLATLPDASVDAVLAEGRPRLLDRSRHRDEHLDAIEAALGHR